MTNLLVLKEHLKHFYGKYDIYIIPVMKFLLAFISLLLINGKLGYMSKIDNIVIVLIVALMCSFLPTNMIIIVSALFTVLHLYSLAMECAVVVTVLFFLLFLLYFRFAPKDTLAVLLTPLCFAMNIPYVMPIAMGLIGTPASVVSVSSGVIVYYVIAYISDNSTAITSLDADSAIQKIRYVIDGMLNNKALIITLIAFTVTILLVYSLRRMSMDHSWTIAVCAGSVTDIVILFIGDIIYNTNISVVITIIGSIIAVLLVEVLQFFVFNVDYSRTEHVQFEDDEYYYYVKAVPKNSVATPERKVRKINS